MTTLTIVLPVFAIIGMGYLFGNRLFGPDAVKILTGFAWRVATPALLFRAMATNGLPKGDDLLLIVAYFATCFVIYFFSAFVIGSIFKLDVAERGLFGMGTTFSNNMMIGIPLAQATFGDEAMRPYLLILAFHAITLVPVTTVFAEWKSGDGSGIRKAVTSTARSMVTTPIIIALFLGMIWAATGLTIPAVADSTIQILAGAAIPTALFAIGMNLRLFPIAGNITHALTITAMKIIVFPLAVYGVCIWLFDFTLLWTFVAMLMAALPTGITVFVVANQYDTSERRIASSIVLSTTLSVITLAIMIAWMKTQI